jgi:hypothetical protein
MNTLLCGYIVHTGGGKRWKVSDVSHNSLLFSLDSNGWTEEQLN